jgi:DNA mismatch repair protein MutS2
MIKRMKYREKQPVFEPVQKNPSPSEPVHNNPFESAMFAAELGDAPEIDLHGEDIDTAMVQLDQFINHEFIAGTEAIKIIHGRGEGRLREAIHKYLRKQTELVAAFRDSQNPGQQGAVTLAALQRMK